MMYEGRYKWPSCRYCANVKLITTYWCGKRNKKCPAGRSPWKQHVKWHEELEETQHRSRGWRMAERA